MKSYQKVLFGLVMFVVITVIGLAIDTQSYTLTSANAARGTVTCSAPIDCGPLRVEARRLVNGVQQRQGGVAAMNTQGNGASVAITRFGSSNVQLNVSTNSWTSASGHNTATRRTGWIVSTIDVNSLRTDGTGRH